MASKRARTLSFFFTLFGALELTGKKIIHNQRRNESRDSKILLWVVIEDTEIELVATIDEPGEKFIHSELFLVGPLADRVHQPSPPEAQVSASRNSTWSGRRTEKFAQIGIIEIGVCILVEFPFPRVVGLEFEIQAIVFRDAILRSVDWRLPRQRAHEFIDVFEFLQCFPASVTLSPVSIWR